VNVRFTFNIILPSCSNISASRDALRRAFGGKPHARSFVSGVSESTLQQYEDQEIPPLSNILIRLAHAANVSIEWLATGRGEMRTPGQLPGATFADVAMVELRDMNAALHMEQICAFLPLSRWWLEQRFRYQRAKGVHAARSGPGPAAGDQEDGSVVVDRSADNKLPRGEGLYVFPVATGLAVRRVEVSLKRGFVVTGPGISEELGPMDIGRLLVGKVIFRGGRM